MNNSMTEPKWYIITAINGSEEVVYKNLEDKIRGYDLTDLVQEIKLLKSREITIEVFDNKHNPPPKIMRSTKSITWETLPGNRYKKTRVREINRFPGYIYIKMIMTPSAWYTIRNTIGVTGFVGSSGKGASPIPMSDEEVKQLFSEEQNKDIIINKSDISYVDNTVEDGKAKEVKVEFFNLNNSSAKSEDDFFDSTKKLEDIEEKIAIESKNENIDENIDFENEINNHESHDEVVHNEANKLEEDIYFSEHDDEIENSIEDKQEVQLEDTNNDHGPKDIFEDKNQSKPTHFENFDFVVGNTVELLSGGMKGQQGIIINVFPEKNEIEIEVDILGRKTKLIASGNDVTKKI